MRYAIILLLIAAGLTIGGTLLSQHEGYVEIGLSNGTYQMQLWYFIVALLAAVVVLLIVFKVVWTIIRLPSWLKHFGNNRRELKTNALLQKGLLAMGKGQWKQAEKILAKGANLSYHAKHDPSVFLTMAAEAAQRQGVTVRRDQYLLEAHQLAADGVNTLATSLSEATLHLDAGEPQKALTVLEEQTGQHRHNAKLQAIACEAYRQLERHDEIWALLPALKKSAPSRQAFEEQQVSIAKALFHSHNSSLAAIEKVWAELPKAAKKDDNLLLAFVSALVYRDEEERAESILAANIRQRFSDPLIHAYTQLETGSSNQRLSKIRNWLKYHPNNAYLNYGAAKLAFQSEHLDEAKTYAEASIKALGLPEAFALLGKIAEAQGDNNAALAAYRGSVNLTYADEKTAVAGELIASDTATALPDKTS